MISYSLPPHTLLTDPPRARTYRYRNTVIHRHASRRRAAARVPGSAPQRPSSDHELRVPSSQGRSSREFCFEAVALDAIEAAPRTARWTLQLPGREAHRAAMPATAARLDKAPYVPGGLLSHELPHQHEAGRPRAAPSRWRPGSSSHARLAQAGIATQRLELGAAVGAARGRRRHRLHVAGKREVAVARHAMLAMRSAPALVLRRMRRRPRPTNRDRRLVTEFGNR